MEAFFQPKVDVRTEQLKGAEALVRWRHPELGVIRPAAFMPAIEAQGLEWDLTRRVIAAAAENCAHWRARGLEVTVAFNISTRVLHDPSLAGRIMEIVLEKHLDPKHMVIEVTESAALEGVGPMLENLSRLRMRGFGLSIDDFGTGHSSLERLAAVPFTELKVDRTFVMNAEKRPASRAMLETSLMSASKLGMVAVAEGVERRAEWDLVRSLGCQMAQGYYIARPVDAAEFLEWAQAKWKAIA
jgi:EAL domain-containing protein (putative c-di-GMP-specific phosphodiesterase class I)